MKNITFLKINNASHIQIENSFHQAINTKKGIDLLQFFARGGIQKKNIHLQIFE
jgi:hypothetical protein